MTLPLLLKFFKEKTKEISLLFLSLYFVKLWCVIFLSDFTSIGTIKFLT